MGMAKPTLRDLPNTPTDQPDNALAAYIDSLPEKRGVLGGGGLSPQNPEDRPMLDQLTSAIVQGTLNDSHVKKIMDRNPNAAAIFANALTTQKAYKEKTANLQNVFTSNFQDAQTLPPDQTGPVRDANFNYQNAIARLNAMGETERADKLAEQWKKVSEATGTNKQDKNINSYALALRAQGLETDDERVNKLNPEQAKNALAMTMPPTVVQTTGGSIVAPRGGVPGQPGAIPNFVPNPKDLSGTDIKELSEVSAAAEQTKNLRSGFKDEYGGFKSSIVGNAVADYKQRFGDETGMGDWWNQYQAKKNVTRNKLFGGALTDTESKEWEKADINPGMSPDQIKKNLARREALEQRAAAKIAKAYRSGSYNKAQVDAATGSDVPQEPKKRVKFSEL